MEQAPAHNTKSKLFDKEKSKAASSAASSKWIIENNIKITPISKPSTNLEPEQVNELVKIRLVLPRPPMLVLL